MGGRLVTASRNHRKWSFIHSARDTSLSLYFCADALQRHRETSGDILDRKGATCWASSSGDGRSDYASYWVRQLASLWVANARYVPKKHSQPAVGEGIQRVYDCDRSWRLGRRGRRWQDRSFAQREGRQISFPVSIVSHSRLPRGPCKQPFDLTSSASKLFIP